RSLLQLLLELGDEARDALVFDGRNGFSIDPGCPAIGSNRLPGAQQGVRMTHLIIERVEPSRRARLGSPIQRPLELSSVGTRGRACGVVSLVGIHPLLPPPGRMDKAGGLPSSTLCCRAHHRYAMPPSDGLSAGTPLRLSAYRSPCAGDCVIAGGGGPPQFSD